MIKSPETRSAELLDCAQRLFFANGYDNTTVNDIIREAGVSKGAFYHYFASKESLLEALAARLARDSLAELQPVLDDPSLDAVDRLNALMAGSRRLNVELAPQLHGTFDVLFRPENVVLFHKIDQTVREIAAPLISAILERGGEEGIFDVPDPNAFADMLLQLRLTFREVMHQALRQTEQGNVDEAARLLDDRLRLYGVAIDRLLKLPDGTIQVAEDGFARAFLEAE
ncbi:TetR/AcrR family transcriptional regulator [Sinorhizobium numidicum]|uniref:TetR/AcrR family transcriptional regulator n=1 Tax=Sinorhizobium numidicum TaxID=680248 RepID=A0ABY8CY60_9HYPH|nr:TetR/AcrR family transcriptional regulator [Sinorhizobium numidicum]WEX75678.1 TetR/AcrR family transcriptional regulator [Sinorhizobium numidicum]WEX81673.1 TetR/AcrR family transcriptional regulator [Sinorhizobium numidicum]